MTDPRPFTALAVSSEHRLLCQLHAMLGSDKILSREQFGDLMKAGFEHCRLDVRQMSDELGFSMSTVYRWIEGRTAPHPSLWPLISEWIAKAIKARINVIVVEREREAADA